MKKLFKVFIIAFLLMEGALVMLLISSSNQSISKPVIQNSPIFFPSPTPTITLQTPPPSKTLSSPLENHIFQTFNNCGPAALSMALSYYGINETQATLGEALRPFQVPGGDNDDKSVTLQELSEKSKDYGFVPYHRPNGNSEIIKQFITYDIPVITRTYLRENEDIGHYRVVKGYDSAQQNFVQDDSLQGKNLRYSYDDFNTLWEKFNFEYLVLVPQEKLEIAQTILGEDKDEKTAWQKALRRVEDAQRGTQGKLAESPESVYDRFNLSVAHYNVGNYKESAEEFEKVESKLPFRTLWYQIEPILAYYELRNYDRVFEITDKILNNHNRAFSELYLIRGEIYKNQGNLEAAKQEFEKAVFYNKNLKKAQDALNSF